MYFRLWPEYSRISIPLIISTMQWFQPQLKGNDMKDRAPETTRTCLVEAAAKNSNGVSKPSHNLSAERRWYRQQIPRHHHSWRALTYPPYKLLQNQPSDLLNEHRKVAAWWVLCTRPDSLPKSMATLRSRSPKNDGLGCWYCCKQWLVPQHVSHPWANRAPNPNRTRTRRRPRPSLCRECPQRYHCRHHQGEGSSTGCQRDWPPPTMKRWSGTLRCFFCWNCARLQWHCHYLYCFSKKNTMLPFRTPKPDPASVVPWSWYRERDDPRLWIRRRPTAGPGSAATGCGPAACGRVSPRHACGRTGAKSRRWARDRRGWGLGL
jgi:hypothetical protein